MNQRQEYEGEWFLPHEPSRKLHGKLKIETESSYILELSGGFIGSDFPIILGKCSGKYITLYNSFTIYNENIFDIPNSRSTYSSNYVFVGVHFFTKRDIKFNKISLKYSHLDEWLNQPNFKTDIDRKSRYISVSYTQPEDIGVPLSSDMKMKIRQVGALSSSNMLEKEIRINQISNVIFEFKRKVDLKTVLNTVILFRNFLTLMIQHPVYVPESYGYLRIGHGKELYPVQMFFNQHNPPSTEKEVTVMDMLIPFPKLADKFDTVISLWFSQSHKFRAVCDPLFATYYASFLYTSDRFLHIARAAEAFHRDILHKPKVAFRERILDLLIRYSKVYSPKMKFKSKPKFADKIRHNRNKFTHSNPLMIDEEERFLETYVITERLKLVVICAILCEHGFTKDEVQTFLKDSRYWLPEW